jgi:hypothetical protein
VRDRHQAVGNQPGRFGSPTSSRYTPRPEYPSTGLSTATRCAAANPFKAVRSADTRAGGTRSGSGGQQVLAARAQPARVVDHRRVVDELERRGEIGRIERRLGPHEDRVSVVEIDVLGRAGRHPRIPYGPGAAAGRAGRGKAHFPGGRARPPVHYRQPGRGGDPHCGATLLRGVHEPDADVGGRVEPVKLVNDEDDLHCTTSIRPRRPGRNTIDTGAQPCDCHRSLLLSGMRTRPAAVRTAAGNGRAATTRTCARTGSPVRGAPR